MLEILAFLFSPFGTVGRLAWWLTQLFCGIAGLLVYGIGFLLIVALGAGAKEHTPSAAVGLGAILVGIAGIIAILMLQWIGLANTIKRWHDRGMSGFMVLLGFVPTLVGVMVFGAKQPIWSLAFDLYLVLAIIVPLYMLIQLGFLPGEYVPLAQPRASRHAPHHASAQQPAAPSGGSFFGLAALALLLGIIDLALAALAFLWK